MHVCSYFKNTVCYFFYSDRGRSADFKPVYIFEISQMIIFLVILQLTGLSIQDRLYCPLVIILLPKIINTNLVRELIEKQPNLQVTHLELMF